MQSPLEGLLRRRPEFVAYLRRQGATPEQADDLVQAAFEKGLEPWRTLPAEEHLVPWFYRVLRNALIDQARRRASATRAIDRYAAEQPVEVERAEPRAVCACTRKVLASLKPEYALLLEWVDVEGLAVEDAARRAQITANNAHVRLHRARRALRDRLEAQCGSCATGGGRCGDCYCSPPAEV